MTPHTLHVVAPEQDQPAPDMSYEHRDRRHIMSRDWDRLHQWSDANPPLDFVGKAVRPWR